tara:strand:- start:2244 stop:2690 length:447 start_codon:yes stop_codon:yes gene_type:complete
MRIRFVPYREKKAWISMLLLLAVSAVYSFFMVDAYNVPDPNLMYLLHLLTLALAAFIVFEVVLLFLAARLSPDDPRGPIDERELLIELKARRLAYFVLMSLVVLITFAITHLSSHGDTWGIGNLYLGALVLAEVVRFAMQIAYFRREA